MKEKEYNISVTDQNGEKFHYNVSIAELPQRKTKTKFEALLNQVIKLGFPFCAIMYGFYGFVALWGAKEYDGDRSFVSAVGCLYSIAAIFFVVWPSICRIVKAFKNRKESSNWVLYLINISVFFVYTYFYMDYAKSCFGSSFNYIESFGDCATIMGIIYTVVAYSFEVWTEEK